MTRTHLRLQFSGSVDIVIDYDPDDADDKERRLESRP